jgi:PAS domain S-box-containing protein
MTESKNIDFGELFEALPDRYVVIDIDVPTFTIVTANNAYLKVTDKKLEDIEGKSMFEVFPDTSELALKTGKGELQRSFEAVIATNQPDSTGVIRYDIAGPSGELEVRYWQATHYPLFKKNKLQYIVQSTADITELFESSEQLKLANLKLEDAMSAGLIGAWSWDIKKDIVTADKGLAHLFGVSSEEALKGLPLQKFTDSIFEDDREVVLNTIEEAVQNSNTFEAEYRTIDTEKNIRWVIARGRIERDKEGNPLHFPGVMIDISSRKETEEKLKESEERFRFMADTMPQLVWITRPDGFHEYYNKHWYTYTGTKDGQTDGEGWNELFHKDDRERAWKVWQNCLKTGEPYEIKYRLYHARSQSYHWVIGRALPFRNQEGEIIKWYGTCTDINDSILEIEERKRLERELQEEKARLETRVAERTEQLKATNDGLRDEIKKRQKVERQLRESGTELRRSNKELEEFAYVSSHDLQEPLRKIQAFGDLLKSEYGEGLGDGEQYLDRMQSSALRMSTLIDDLLTFSRVSTKRATPVPVDLNETLEGVLSDLEDRIRREGGKVQIDTILPVVNADQTHMQQLFQNLISNGLKFHEKDTAPILHISASEDDETVEIRIEDNGIGIDQKYKDKIFSVFQRLNSKQAYEGTGIGLAVCKKIVDRYGGTIKIESQLGKGTTFIINLPKEFEE